MMMLRALPLLLLGLTAVHAQDTDTDTDGDTDTDLILTGTVGLSLDDSVPTDPSLYTTLQSTRTVSSLTGTPTDGDDEVTPTLTGSDVFTTTSDDYVLLVGSQTTQTLSAPANETTLAGNGTRTQEPSALPTNTRPCNGYPEFCERQYGNITEIAAHNSPFTREGNLGRNQELDVTTQLNDGVRMLQFQTHDKDGEIHLCHSTCDLLDAGTLEAYLAEVSAWLKANPYEVVSLLIGNSDVLPPSRFSDPLRNSGLLEYAYEPPIIPMGLSDWPKLSKMILSNKRAVIFMDYEANQDEVPYILDQFSQMWETPFSPTDRSFPCTVQRPPDLSPESARSRLYMANHNLNTEVSLVGTSLLVPNTVLLNETNAPEGFGSLGAMAGNCTEKWNRPPNFLLVDYYNIGSVNGSVFHVAAEMNGVEYNGLCCGSTPSAAHSLDPLSVQGYLALLAVAYMVL